MHLLLVLIAVLPHLQKRKPQYIKRGRIHFKSSFEFRLFVSKQFEDLIQKLFNFCRANFFHVYIWIKQSTSVDYKFVRFFFPGCIMYSCINVVFNICHRNLSTL